MRRISLHTYLELAEHLERIRSTLTQPKTSKGDIFFALMDTKKVFSQFSENDKAFTVSKHAINEALESIDNFIKNFVYDENGKFEFSNLDDELERWQYISLTKKFDSLKSVLLTECHDASIYFVDQVLIYDTASLVERASARIPQDIRDIVPENILYEFDQAGKALAFELYTACGFHVLRSLEIMMEHYLIGFNYNCDKFSTWWNYIDAMKKLSDDKTRAQKPSKKVAAMLDRIRELDRNPLMHPQDTLDSTQAETLFSLSTITIIEMTRDLASKEPLLIQGNLPLIPSPPDGANVKDNSETSSPARSRSMRRKKSLPDNSIKKQA